MAGVISRSFTSTSFNGLLSVLTNECGVSTVAEPGAIPPKTYQFFAIWDTGATNSVISQKVIDACGLAPVGMRQVHGVHGPSDAEVFLVDMHLPNAVTFHAIEATKGSLGDADILIGMDIICQGDFAVTNVGGLTKFSFRIPSLKHIDFVAETRELAARQAAPRAQHSKKKRAGKTFGRKKK